MEFKPQQPVELSSVLSAASPDAMDLLQQLLVLRPDKRATAREALQHPFFTKHEPKPCAPSELALPIPEERKHKVRRETGAPFAGGGEEEIVLCGVLLQICSLAGREHFAGRIF